MSGCRPCSLQADTCPCKKNVLIVQEICARNIRTSKLLSFRLLETGKMLGICLPSFFLNSPRHPGLVVTGERSAGLDKIIGLTQWVIIRSG